MIIVLSTKAEKYVVCSGKQFLEAYIFDRHDFNTDLNNLSTKVLSIVCCVLDKIYSVFSKFVSYEIMLKLHSITSFNSVRVRSKIIKIGNELTSE